MTDTRGATDDPANERAQCPMNGLARTADSGGARRRLAWQNSTSSPSGIRCDSASSPGLGPLSVKGPSRRSSSRRASFQPGAGRSEILSRGSTSHSGRRTDIAPKSRRKTMARHRGRGRARADRERHDQVAARVRDLASASIRSRRPPMPSSNWSRLPKPAEVSPFAALAKLEAAAIDYRPVSRLCFGRPLSPIGPHARSVATQKKTISDAATFDGRAVLRGGPHCLPWAVRHGPAPMDGEHGSKDDIHSTPWAATPVRK